MTRRTLAGIFYRMGNNCPSCGSSDTAKLQMIHESGLHQASFVGMSIGQSDNILGAEGQSQSLLSQRSQPPRRASQTPVLIGIASAVFAILLFARGCGNLQSYYRADHDEGWGQIIFGVVCVVVTVGAFFVALANAAWDRNEYPKLYSEWAKKWMCRRCGTVFIAD